MADPTSGSGSIGGVSVDVTANLDPLRQGFAQGKVEAEGFGKAAQAALDGVESSAKAAAPALDKVAQGQKALADAQKAGSAITAKMIQDAGGYAAAEKVLAGAIKEVAQAHTAETAAAKQASAAEKEAAAAAKAQAAAQKEVAQAQAAAEKAGQRLVARLEEQVATQGKGKAALAEYRAAQLGVAQEAAPLIAKLGETAHASSTVTREILVLGREASRGNFSRMAGSATILAQALGLMPMLLNPVVLGIAAITAVAVAGVVAIVQYGEALKHLQEISVGVGREAGLTATQIESASEKAANASIQSVQATRKESEAFVAAGVQSQDAIAALDVMVVELAHVTGEKAAQAQKELAAAMEDPTKGAVELNNKLHFLTDTQVQHIARTQELSGKYAAQNELIQLLTSYMQNAGVKANDLGGFFDRLARGASLAWTWVGNLNDQLARFNAFRSGGQPALDKIDGARAQAQMQAERRQAAARVAAENSKASTAGGALARELIPGSEDLDQLRAKQATLARAMAADSATGAGNLKQVSQAYDAVTRAINTYLPPAEKAHQIAVLEAQIGGTTSRAKKAELTLLLERTKLSGEVITAAEAEQKSQDAATKVADKATKSHGAHAAALKRAADAEIVNAAGALKVAEAYGVSDAAALKAEATRKAVTAATQKGISVEEETRRQLALTIAQDAEAGAKRAAQARAEADASKAMNDRIAGGMAPSEAQRMMKEELAMRPLLVAQAAAEGHAKEVLTDVIKRLTVAQKDSNAEAIRTAGLAAVQAEKDQTGRLEKELALVNATTTARRQALAVYDEQQRLEKGGVKPGDPNYAAAIAGATTNANLQTQVETATFLKTNTDRVREQIAAYNSLAATMGMTNQAADQYKETQRLLLEAQKAGLQLKPTEILQLQELAYRYSAAADAARKLQESQKAAADASKFLGDQATSALDALIFGGGKAQDVLHNLVRALGQAVLQATLMGQGPLAGLFGTSQSATVGGPNGGLFSGLQGMIQQFMPKLPGMPTSGGLAGAAAAKQFPAASFQAATFMSPNFVGMGGIPGMGGSGGGIGDLFSSLFGGGGASSSAATDAMSMLTPSSLMAFAFHGGADSVGSSGHTAMRSIPAPVMLAAPRFHNGLAPDEFPAILQRGERVTRAGGGGGSPTVIMQVMTPDPGAFRRSDRQIARQVKQRLA